MFAVIKTVNMKTNVIMNRPMGDLIVNQRTSDGMFNATALLNQWNKTNNVLKKIGHFFSLRQTDDFLKVLINEENLHGRNHDLDDNQAIKTIKGKNTNTGREPDIVWMHPYLFIKFAMWLNPKFEYFVIKFVYDSLIELRKVSADLYIELCNATNWYFINNYNKEATMEHYTINAKIIQQLVLGKIVKGNPWQDANEKELRLRTDLQKILISCYNKNMTMEKTRQLLESRVELSEII
jgi:hypothetical protein